MKLFLCIGLLWVAWAAPAAAQSCGTQCGIGCPTGCYPQSTQQNSRCPNNVDTACGRVAGSQLSSCGNQCPAGYYVSALRESSGCRVGYSSEQVDCRQVSGDSLSTCGTACPAGYYVNSLRQDSSNCRNAFKNNRVDCRQVKGASFSTCGISCPAGYYVDALRSDSSNCPNEFKNNRVTCRQVSGDFFSACGNTCPAGYSISALRSDPSNCPNEFLNNRVDCQKVSGDTLFQCGTSCPAGYYVASLKPDPSSCPNELQNNEVECRKVSGGAFSTCGTSCPTGYYVDALRSDSFNCSGTLFKNNKVDCRQVSGDFFSACGNTCPAGYSVAALRSDPSNCPNEFLNNRVDCRKVSGDTLFQCGTSCPAGYYVASLKPDPSSCPNELRNNEVECRKVSGGAFSTCGLSCPAGYYVDALDADPSNCPNEFLNNRVSCRQVSGGFLSTCGTTCPAGYHVEALNPDPSNCPNEFKNNRVDCRLTNGDFFSTCGTTCPAGYYVSALDADPSRCPNEFLNNRASCRKVNGQTLVTCGSSCPPGYSQIGVDFEPDCGGMYNNQASTCRLNGSQGPTITNQPQSVTICAGQPATLTVTASSGQSQNPLSYQWFIGKSPNQTQRIQGATSASVQVSPAGTTEYWVLVSNSQGQVPSATATVTVNQLAVITAQPQPATVEAGQPATLTVGATGTSLSYRWYAGQTGDTSHPVPGGTGASVQVSPRTKTSYWVRVTNSCNSVDSAAAEVTVFCTGPSLTGQPQPVTIQAGQPATLTVGATGTLLSYQWYEGNPGDTSRPVGTGPSIQVTPGATTKYWVRVSNACGDTIDSSAATVTVCIPPGITGQPQSVSIVSGQTATLAVNATGAPLSYQWYEGETGDVAHPVPGGTGSSLQVAPSSTKKYWVRISNTCGDTIDSSTATVTVCSPPAILGTGQPQSVSIVPGESATLTVTATGTSLSYQWYEGPVGSTLRPVPNGTGPSIVVAPDSTASYWVRVTNDCGSTDSNAATVTVISCDDPGSEGMSCSADGNRTCRSGQCVCTNCASGACCGASGNSYCDGQTYLDPNTGYTGVCTSTLPACTAANDFDGTNTVYHDGEVLGCVKANGTHQWYPRRPSPRCQEVSPVCGFLCSTHYNNGSGFMCDQNGVWNQSPPLPDCYDGTIPDGWSCELPPVCVAPGFLTQPQSLTIQAGQPATLSTAASGTSPLFRWYRGLSGDTSDLLQTGSADSIVVTPAATTSYWVQAFNACGTADSQTATVTVSPICMPASISTQPQSVTIEAGQSATLSVGATGTSPLSYQWYRGPVGSTSNPVPGGTGPSITVAPSSTTSYWVRVSNSCRTLDSQGATVTVEEDVCIPAHIETQPQSASIYQGDLVVLSVGASGTALSYQWYEGTASDTSNPVPGGTGNTLLVSPDSTTSYWVRVENDCGLDDSGTATITVNGCGPDGAACGGDGHHTCQGGQCVCTDCGSPACCGAPGNTWCDGQQITDPSYFYTAACTSSLPACGPGNDFNGDDEVFHNGDVFACVKFNGEHQWFPRRPSPLCQTVAQVCDYLCAYNFGGGMGFQCQEDGFWGQNPPLPYCFDGTIPESFLCD